METALYWMQSPAGQMGAPAQLGGSGGNWMRSQTKFFFFHFWLRWVFTAACGLSQVAVCRSYTPVVALLQIRKLKREVTILAPGHIASIGRCLLTQVTGSATGRYNLGGLSLVSAVDL